MRTAILAVESSCAGYEPGAADRARRQHSGQRGRDRRRARTEWRRQVDPDQGDRAAWSRNSRGSVALERQGHHARPRRIELVRERPGLRAADRERLHAACRLRTICALPPIFLPKPDAGSRRSTAMFALFPDLARQTPARGGPAVRRPAPDAGGGPRADRQAAHPDARRGFGRTVSQAASAQVFAKLAEIRATGITILIVEQNAKAALALGRSRLDPGGGPHRA